MSIHMTDVTFHLDEKLEHDAREKVRDTLLAQDGVMAAASKDETPHLVVVEYGPDLIDPISILGMLKKAPHTCRAARVVAGKIH
jgi:hypothetical protein